MPESREQHAYLTILAESMDLNWDDFLATIADVADLDRLTVQQRLAKSPPQILARMEESRSADLARRLQARGIEALSVTARRLATLGSPMLVKFMTATADGYEIDLWQGPSTSLSLDAVQTLIRASARSETKRARPSLNVGNIASRTAGYGYVRLPPQVGDVGRARPSGQGDSTVVHKASELIDIHTDHGLWFRINGDKFAWHVLGKERDLADRLNADRLTDRLAHQAPQATLDTFYSLFKPPPGNFMTGRDAVAFGTKHAQGLGQFDFYSRWVCVVYRHLSRGG